MNEKQEKLQIIKEILVGQISEEKLSFEQNIISQTKFQRFQILCHVQIHIFSNNANQLPCVVSNKYLKRKKLETI